MIAVEIRNFGSQIDFSIQANSHKSLRESETCQFLSHLVVIYLYLNFYLFIFYLSPLGSQLNPLNHILSHFIQAGIRQTLSRKLCPCLNWKAVSWFFSIYRIKKNSLLLFSFSGNNRLSSYGYQQQSSHPLFIFVNKQETVQNI